MRVLLISCLLIGSVICAPVEKEYGDNSAGTSRHPFSSGNLVSGIGVSSGSGLSLPSPTNLISGNTGLPAPQDVSSSTGSGSYPGTNMAVGNAFGGYATVGAPGGNYVSGYDSSANAGYRVESSAPGGSYAGGYDRSANVGYGFDSSVPGGSYASGYDSSASVGYGFDSGYDSSANVGYGFDSGYDSSANVGYGFDSSALGGSYASGYDSSASTYVGDSGTSGFAYGYDAGDDLEPVFSDVSDLEPVYTLSSRSSYQRGRAVFDQTRYTPGEPVPQQMPVRRVVSKTSKQSSPKAPTKGAF